VIPRKPVVSNHRSIGKLMSEFNVNKFHIKYPKSGERQSIFSHIRPGRSAQDDGASGGGYRVF
jgi:hypothetical protein